MSIATYKQMVVLEWHFLRCGPAAYHAVLFNRCNKNPDYSAEWRTRWWGGATLTVYYRYDMQRF